METLHSTVAEVVRTYGHMYAASGLPAPNADKTADKIIAMAREAVAAEQPARHEHTLPIHLLDDRIAEFSTDDGIGVRVLIEREIWERMDRPRSVTVQVQP